MSEPDNNFYDYFLDKVNILFCFSLKNKIYLIGVIKYYHNQFVFLDLIIQIIINPFMIIY